jgi:PKD repeat protein
MQTARILKGKYIYNPFFINKNCIAMKFFWIITSLLWLSVNMQQAGAQTSLISYNYGSPSQCNGCDGWITVSTQGGTAPYTFEISQQGIILTTYLNAQNNEAQFNGICVGTYVITVTDALGQKGSVVVTIPGFNASNLIADVRNPSCSGGYNGQISLSYGPAGGGSTQASYFWNNGATGPFIEGLSAGTYCVTVSNIDINGNCTSTQCYTLTDPCPLVVSLTEGNNAPATLNANAYGGTPPYSYSWSNSATGPSIPLQSGTYTATVTDANGCTAYGYYADSGNTGFVSSLTPISCTSTTGTITIYFPTTIYNPDLITWSGPSIVNNFNSPNNGSTIIVNEPGFYTACGINADSIAVCETFYMPSLGGFTLIPITSSNPAYCNNLPNGQQSSCEKVCPGTTVTYSAGAFSIACGTSTPPVLKWTIEGAETYTISPDKKEVTVTWGTGSGGLITVEGDSTSACYSGSQCVTIVDQPEAAFFTSPAQIPGPLVVCKGQKVNFNNTSKGADIYDWTFSDDFSNTTETNPSHTYNIPGFYKVTLIARSLCLCADTAEYEVYVIDAPTPIVDCVNSICPGEEVTYTTNSTCGQYTWTVSPNGSIVSGGGPTDTDITIQWTNGIEGEIGLTTTACSGTVCPAKATLIVPILSDLAKIEGKTRVCPNEEAGYSIQEFDGAGYTWSVSPGGSIIDGQGRPRINVQWGSTAAPQWVAVEYNNCYLGCIGRDTLPVIIRPPFGILGTVEACAGTNQSFSAKQIPGGSAVACNWELFAPNGSSVASTSNAISFQHTFNANMPGKYRVFATPIGTGLNQTCSDSAEKKITLAALPPKPLGIQGPKEFCAGKSLTYTATGVNGLYNVNWKINTGGGNIIPETGNPINTTFTSFPAPHWIAASQISTDGLNCTSDTVRLNVKPIQPFIVSGPIERCEGTSATYTIPVFENVDYAWQIIPATAGVIKEGDGSHEIEVFWTTPGNHTIAANACGQSANIQVNVWANPEPDITSPIGICPTKTGISVCNDIYNNYAWKNASGAIIGNNQDITTGAGNYALVVTDANGCKGTSEFTIDAWPNPNLSISTTDPTGFCNNSRTVTIDALLDEDFEYTYEWYKDGTLLVENGPSLNTNQYGLYTAVVTNQYGCTATDGPINVFEYCVSGGVCHNPGHPVNCPPGTLGMSITPTMYCDSFDFKLLPSPNYAPGTVTWNFGESGSTLLGTSNLENTGFNFPNAGHYIVVMYAFLTNGAECKLLDSVDVEAAALFSVKPDCPGSPTQFTDESTFLPSGAIAQWKWDFNDFTSANSDTSLLRNPAWNYALNGLYPAKLTITASSGCISEYTKTVKIPILPPVSFVPQAPDCAGNATPLAVLNASNLTNAHWKFGDPASGPQDSISGFAVVHRYLNPGNYTATVTITNIDGCSNSGTQAVPIVPNTLNGQITPANPTLCEGASVLLSAPAAPVGSTYLWSNNMNTKDILVLQEGNYTVTITSPDGCTYTPNASKVEVLPVPVGKIKALLFNDLGQIEGSKENNIELCFGEDTHLRVFDNGNYGYKWSNDGNDEDLIFSEDRGTLLNPGLYTYTVTITSSNGCTLVTPPFTVNMHDVPKGFTAAASQPCAGTPSTVSYTGPQPANWQFVWNSGDIGTSFATTVPGHYFVRVVNEFGCIAESNKVTIHPGPNIGSIPGGCHTRCTPDSMCITPLPDIVSWQWFFEGTPIAGATTPQLIATQSGTYYAALEDINGCKAQSGPLNLTLFVGFGDVDGQVWSDVNNNGIIDAADTLVSNIPVVLWQNGVQLNQLNSQTNGSFSFQNIQSVDYNVALDTSQLDPLWEIVIGADPVSLLGCDDKENTDLLIHKITCTPVNSSLNVKVCSGDTYTYNGATIAAGSTQSFTVTNAVTGCDSIVTVAVTAYNIPSSSIAVKICPSDVFTYQGVNLAVGQSQQFTLNNPATGCDSLVNVSVSAFPVPSSNLAAQVCSNATFTYQGINLAVGQSQQFTLNNPATGCDSLVNVSVSAFPVPSSNLAAKVCSNATFTYQGVNLAVGQSQQFTLNNPATGCDSLVNVSVSAFPVPSSNLSVKICENDQYAYQNTNLQPGQSQQFTLINPTTGCDSLVTVTVQGVALPITDLLVNVCPGRTYTYNNKQLTADSTYEFHYFTQQEQCDSTVFITVEEWEELRFDISTTASCAGTPTGTATLQTLSGALPVEWIWGSGNFQNTTMIDDLSGGIYTVTVKDANGCTYSATDTIAERLPLQVDLPTTILLPCDTPTAKLLPIIAGDTTNLAWIWNTGATTNAIDIAEIGVFSIKTSNICESITRSVEVKWADGPENKDFVFVPNVFEPEADEPANSQFKAFISPNVEVLRFKMEVFDRWGNLEFRALQQDQAWDAMVRRKMGDTAVYVWYLEIDLMYCGQMTTIKKKGDITLVR